MILGINTYQKQLHLEHSDCGNTAILGTVTRNNLNGAQRDCESTVILGTESKKRRLDLGHWEVLEAQ
jgi:hypothetical protein